MPTSPPDFQNPYGGWARKAAGLTLAAIALALIPALIPDAPLIPFVVAGTIAATVGGILAIAFWLSGRGVEPQLAAFRDGRWLARWPVPHDRFEAWALTRATHAKKMPLIIAMTIALGGGPVALLFAFDGDLAPAAFTGVCTVLLAGVAWAALSRATTRGLKLRGIHPPELVIGERAAVLNGVIYQWRGVAWSFISVTVLEEPPALRIVYAVDNQGTQVEQTLDLPCTPDRLAEARALASKLRAAG